MKVKILDNEHYHKWAEGFYGPLERAKIHYLPFQVFDVIKYRHNQKDFYEARWETLSEKHKQLCPTVSADKIFWIEKRCTMIVPDDEDELEYNLPKELFEI